MLKRLLDPNHKFADLFNQISEVLYRLPAFIFFAWVTYGLVLLADRAVPAVLHDPSVLTEHIQSGKSMVVGFQVDRTKVCRVQYNQTIYDSNNTRFILPTYISLGNRGIVRNQLLRMNVQLPEGMAPGPAKYESERQYACNFTQLIIPLYVPDPDIFFTVEK